MATTSVFPPHRVAQDEVKAAAVSHFRERLAGVDSLATVFDNSGVDHRYFSKPLEWHLHQRSWAERIRVYCETAVDLASRSVGRLQDEFGIEPDTIDSIVFCSTTGMATPTVDARLMNRFRFRSCVRRTPLWGLGCAGGVSAMAHARHYVCAEPRARVLVISVELCGLTFLPDDYSKSNFVACALFGDGASAVVVDGDARDSAGPDLVAAGSSLYPDTLDVTGWNFVDEGLQVVFSARIPGLIGKYFAADVQEFLGRSGVRAEDVTAWLFHPGGSRVLDAYQGTLSLAEAEIGLSRALLARVGNISSATILVGLDMMLKECSPSGSVVLNAFGPGFSSESALLRF